jgi:arabinan endo-1,5-alpha-L-arabinosidase
LTGGEPPGIGIATADSPEGPFEDHGKLFDSEEIGVPNSIDPQLFIDDGTPYLFWGSFEGIYGIELTEDGFDTVGEKFRVAGDLFEGVYMVKRNDRYYMFVSSGSCCKGNHSTYQVEVGRSDSLRGPYLNEYGRDLLYSHGRLVVDSDGTWAGPGHNALLTDDDGTDWLIYHAYDRDEPWIGEPEDDFGGGDATPRRPLVIDPLDWREGWPAVDGLAPSTEQQAPVVRW